MKKIHIINTLLGLSLMALISCKGTLNNQLTDESFSTLHDHIQNSSNDTSGEYRVKVAAEMVKESKSLENLVDEMPALIFTTQNNDGFVDTTFNQSRYEKSVAQIKRWIEKVNAQIEKSQKRIYELGKNSYAVGKNGRLANTPEGLATNEALIMFNLTYLRNFVRAVSKVQLPVILKYNEQKNYKVDDPSKRNYFKSMVL